MSDLKDNIALIEQQIKSACLTHARTPSSIKLLAVSKTKPSELLAQAYQLGQRDFGENYVQEGLQKIAALGHLPGIVWHFIGPIQTNKTKAIAEHFSWVQSVDRAKIVERLNQQRGSILPALNVCIQVNIDQEPTKSGVLPEQVFELAQQITNCTNLRLRGLMAIPAVHSDQASYNKMQQLFNDLQQRYANVDTLSLGMSADIEAAIAAGSTMLRIGSAFFGQRH